MRRVYAVRMENGMRPTYTMTMSSPCTQLRYLSQQSGLPVMYACFVHNFKMQHVGSF